MAVALVLDFPGGTQEQYNQVVERMQLGGRMAPGGRVHVAGSHAGGWRVIDVWESFAKFEHFRDTQIIPHVQAVGLAAPQVHLFEVDDEMPNDGRAPTFAQRVVLPGLDRAAFRALNDEVVPGGVRPDGVTFHVNGPFQGGWCVIDGWTTRELRDRFMDRTRQIIVKAPVTAEPTVDEMVVEATLTAAPATART